MQALSVVIIIAGIEEVVVKGELHIDVATSSDIRMVFTHLAAQRFSSRQSDTSTDVPQSASALQRSALRQL